MNNQKNILFLSSWYPNRNNATHGIFNRFFAEAALNFNNVFVIHVCSENSCKNNFEIEVTNNFGFEEVIVYFQKSSNPISKYLNYKKAYQKALNYFLEKKIIFDVIHCNVILNAGIAALFIKKQLAIPLVVNENWTGYLPEDGNYKGFFKIYFTKKIIKNADAILPVTQHLKNAMQKHNLQGNYTIVPNVCNTNLFKITSQHTDDETKFIHISALVNKQKNIFGLLRVFTEALKQNQKINLVIVGEGGDENEIKQFVIKNNIEHKIKLVGKKIGEDLVKEINKADCLVMFSNYENLPLVILESMACGKPVISSNVGGISEAVNNTNGILIDSGNEPQLLKAILEFKKEQYPPALIREHVVKNYSSEVIGKMLNEVYRSFIK